MAGAPLLSINKLQLQNRVGASFTFPERLRRRASATLWVSGRTRRLGMPDAMTDRRAAPRYPLILLVEITDRLSSAKFTARTSDVSRTGCYVDMLNPLPRGTQIDLRLTNQKEIFESMGTVIYVSPGLGIGVAFAKNIPADQLAVLDRWLAAAAKTTR
jgi:hypothetical protein